VRDEPRNHSGLSIKTLLIAGAASATAALVVPLFWRPGTVFAAAMTPVIVSVVSELLKRPTEKVTTVATRRATGGGVIFEPPPEEPFDPLAPAPTEELEALPQTTSQRAVHRRPLTGRQWKLALVTGLVAFAGAATVVTASELLAGDSVSSSGGRTTFFSGSQRNKDTSDKKSDAKEKATPSATPEETETRTPTPTPSPSPTPTPTVTPAPSTEAAPAPQAAPSASPVPTP
jgi:hypothetical protein